MAANTIWVLGATGKTGRRVADRLILAGEVFDGRNASVKDGVTRALGRAPRDFSDCVRDTAATGVWNWGPQS
jgi:uncharacterized protein YbjT (DUF2867 family)